MIPDHAASTATESNLPAAQPASRWRRFWTRLAAYVEAMELSYDEIQDRRIAALETEVVRLRGLIANAD